jgi:hypothetical protein
MKLRNLYFFFISAVLLVATSACNLSYTCECTEGGRVVATRVIKTVGRGGAKSVCTTYEEQAIINGAVNYNCVIQ